MDVELSDTPAWDAAYSSLLNLVMTDKVSVVGLPQAGEQRRIDGAQFVGLPIDHPFQGDRWDLWATDEVHLRSVPYVDDYSWRHGDDDSIRTRWGVIWSRLMISKADVAKWWPFDSVPLRSGLPGRPTSAHLMIAEFKRRCASGLAVPSLVVNAKSLCEWLEQTHPEAHQTKPKSVADNIRGLHNAYWAERKMKVSG